jgi:cardiolipin synthase
MNLANRITLVRIALTPLFLILLLSNYLFLVLAVFSMMAITDAIDGFIARAKKQRTQLGSFLDPLADKLLLTTAFISLAVLQIFPSWVAIVIVSRDVIIVLGVLGLFLLSGKCIIAPSVLGKSSSALQMITVAFALLLYALEYPSPFPNYLSLFTVLLTLVSGVHYIYLGTRILNGTVDELRKTVVS